VPEPGCPPRLRPSCNQQHGPVARQRAGGHRERNHDADQHELHGRSDRRGRGDHVAQSPAARASPGEPPARLADDRRRRDRGRTRPPPAVAFGRVAGDVGHGQPGDRLRGRAVAARRAGHDHRGLAGLGGHDGEPAAGARQDVDRQPGVGPQPAGGRRQACVPGYLPPLIQEYSYPTSWLGMILAATAVQARAC